MTTPDGFGVISPTRRKLLRTLCALPVAAGFTRMAVAQQQPDFAKLKSGYAQRLKNILSSGALPYIDIESSCNSSQVDIDSISRSLDELNIGLMALSADLGRNQFRRGERFDALSERLLAKHPDRFIPVGNGAQPPAFTEAPAEFLEAHEKAAGRLMLLGEFEFRHYPSPRQVKSGQPDRDVSVPIDGPTGERVFALSDKTGLAFQIHYEIEDALLEPLERMLAQHPKAKLIWCHLAQVRYAERASRYTAAYVEGLLKRFPNLYFDTAFGDAYSVYPLSGQRHARVWAENGSLRAEWRDLIVAHPDDLPRDFRTIHKWRMAPGLLES